MTAADLLARCRRASAAPVRYRLGGGGMSPLSATPADAGGGCDCSGAVAWALGRSRRTVNPFYVRYNGGWVSSDSIYADILDCVGMFRQLDAAKPGAVIVFGGRQASRGRRNIGHVGIVTAAEGGKPTKVWHCSMGNHRATNGQHAIRETDPAVFLSQPDTLVGWFEGIE